MLQAQHDLLVAVDSDHTGFGFASDMAETDLIGAGTQVFEDKVAIEICGRPMICSENKYVGELQWLSVMVVHYPSLQ